MIRNARLNCESLEAREVPAIVVAGTLPTPAIMAGMPPVPNGGSVIISEVALAPTDSVINQAFNAFEAVTKDGMAGDNITLTQNGNALTITSADGIFVSFVNGGTTFFHNVGTTLTIQNVTGLNVNLQLGGNDTVTDNTMLTATINGGIGDDTITAGGMGGFNPLLLQLLQQPGGLNPALLQALGGMGGQKTLLGGAGGDKLTGPIFGFLNQLDGGDGMDQIMGGLGLDIITGGGGSDILFGFGGGDFYIGLDFAPDFILNQTGDTVFGDAFDIKSVP